MLTDECIGCGLCVAPCPVDCIDVFPIEINNKPERAEKAKQRHKARQLRLQQEAQQCLPVYNSVAERQAAIRREIQESLARKLNN